MGNRCSWPINKYSNSKDELFIDIPRKGMWDMGKRIKWK